MHPLHHSRIALAIASALVAFSSTATATTAIHNESVTLDKDTTVTMLVGNKLSHNAAIGVDYTNPDKTYVVETNGHKLTLTVGDKADPTKMHIGISALTSKSKPSETTVGKASDLLVKGDVELNIVTDGWVEGIRNTGASDITINGNVTGLVQSNKDYVFGIDNFKFGSVTTINGNVDLNIISKSKNTAAFGITAIGRASDYTPQEGEVVKDVDAIINFNGERTTINTVAAIAVGLRTAQSGQVHINSNNSLINTTAANLIGVDVGTTGRLEYKKGVHTVATTLDSSLGNGVLGNNIGLSNLGHFTVGQDVDQFNLTVTGVDASSSHATNPNNNFYSAIAIISDEYKGDNPIEGFDYSSHIKLLGKTINIAVSDGKTDAKDANIGGAVIQNSTLQTNAQTQLNMNVSSATTGVVHGLVAESGSDVDILGNASIRLDAQIAKEATALKADHGGNVLLAGANNEIVGDINVTNKSVVSFEKGSTLVAGDINFDATSQMNMNSSSIELVGDSTMNVNGVLQSKNGQILFNNATPGIVNISTLSDNSTLEAVATPQLNDQLGGNIAKFSEALVIDKGGKGTQLTMKEGLVAGETTGILNETGKLDQASVSTKTNSLMQSSLELASAAPLALNRIMMNDVRKRLGDIRTTQGTHGIWARYDGGKLTGEGSLKNEFNTIQVGIDTVPTEDSARMGVTFSYTDSDAEYVRGNADMKAYSIAMYGTKMFENGMFFDIIGRMGTADTDLTVDGKHKGTMDNVVLGVSGEMGWRFALSDTLFVEPQAEMTYTYVNGDNLKLSTASYDVDSVNSLMGRIGFATGFKCPADKGNVYVRASAVHEFLGDSKITGTNLGQTDSYEIKGKDTWVEYGIGANLNLTKSTYVWADVERTTGGALDEDWRATVGVRYAF